jgi:hypothetical protein
MNTVLYLLAAPAAATVMGLLLALYAMHADKPPAKSDQPAAGRDQPTSAPTPSAMAE